MTIIIQWFILKKFGSVIAAIPADIWKLSCDGYKTGTVLVKYVNSIVNE